MTAARRRTIATLVAAAAVLVLGVVAARMPVPYVTVSPGPTVDVLDADGGKGGGPIISVAGHRTYPTEGELRLTTVSVTNPDHQVSLGEAFAAWVGRDDTVLPRAAMYPATSSSEQEEAESSAQMVSSQDTAIAAALRTLGYRLPTYAEVTGVTPRGPSDGKLEPRDRFLRIDGRRITSVRQVYSVLGESSPGDRVTGLVERDGERKTFTVTTGTAPDDADRAILGVLVSTGFEFPFDVRVGIDDSIGGPSAGLVFALSVYDTLTPGALTGGHEVAGTGTITAGGRVGPIGGIGQKIVGAREAGAELFLVPPDNCEEALMARADDLRLVRADSLRSAVRSLETYADDPSAALPECPS